MRQRSDIYGQGAVSRLLNSLASSGSVTPLHAAITSPVIPDDGRRAYVKLLLEHGADPRIRTGAGKTCLDLARAADHPDREAIRMMEDAARRLPPLADGATGGGGGGGGGGASRRRSRTTGGA